MFEKPNVPKREKGVLGKTAEGIKAAVAGATLLGAVGATELPGGALGFTSQAEAQESFNFEREAKAFVDAVSSMDVGINDARGRRTLRTKIEEKFSVFAFACANRSPYYSAGGNVSVGGAVTYEMREAARTYLQPRLDEFTNQGNVATEILRELVTGQPSEHLSKNPPISRGTVPGPGALPKSEVRRHPGYLNGDW